MLKRADQVQGVEYPSANDVTQLTLCTFGVVPSHEISESHVIEANDYRVYEEKMVTQFLCSFIQLVDLFVKHHLF
jgi:hypothetical protein